MKRHTLNLTVGLAAGLASVAAAGSPEYELVIIEPWDTSYQFATSGASGLNNLNQVSGGAYNSNGDPQFLWTLENGKQPINFAGQINDLGVIAASGAIRWPDGTIEPFEWPMHGVGEINNSNVIAGSTGNVHTCPKHASGRDAAVWTQAGGTVRLDVDLGIFGADQAWGINEGNEVVGVRSVTGQCGDQKAFYMNMTTGQYVDLHSVVTGMSSGITHAYDINNDGVVVGDGPINGLVQPFTWSIANGVTVLPTLPDADPQYTEPVSINNHGVVVGQALDFTDDWQWKAVIWEDGAARDLNLLVELPDDFHIVEAKKINDNGWIIGRGEYGVWSPERAVVLIPIEDPAEPTADLNDDGSIDVFDLITLLTNWGTNGPGADIAAPVDVVDVFDLVELLAAWSQ